MDLTNVQPVAPIGGQQAGSMPGVPQGLGQRESARAVLSTMLETPALPTAVSGGDGTKLQSVMGQLVGSGLREFVTAAAAELPVFSSLQDNNGAALSLAMKEKIARELTAMIVKTFATAALPAASPTKALALESPIRVLENALATSLASSSSGKSIVTIANPMQHAVQGKRVAIATFMGQADLACLKFQEASDRHVVAGRDLGTFVALTRELQPADHNTAEGANKILEITAHAMPIMNRKSKDFPDNVSSAETYKKFCEERMWGVLTTNNVGLDKSTYPTLAFPSVVEPIDRKAGLLSFLEWTKRPSVVKKYYALIAGMRAMATVMDAVTGVYDKPCKKHAALLQQQYNR